MKYVILFLLMLNLAFSQTCLDVKSYAKTAAQKYRVEQSLFLALVEQESGFQQNALLYEKRYRSFSVGPAQVMPATALAIGCVRNALELFEDARKSLDCGAQYMGMMLKKYQYDVRKALTAYNSGPANVDKRWPNMPQSFADSVLEKQKKYRGTHDGGTVHETLLRHTRKKGIHHPENK